MTAGDGGGGGGARDRERQLGGEIAIDVTLQLAEPVRALRDRLGLVVDHLERHVGTSTGPTPYPWRSLQALRQDLGAAYLESTQLASRLDELDRALAPPLGAWFDAAAAVDLGLRLATHHLGGGAGAGGDRGIELLFDLGQTAPVRGEPGTLALIVAQLVAECARSARAAAGSSLSVRVAGDRDGAWVLVVIADNGAGSSRAAALGDLARDVLAASGALVDAASADGQGCVFEIRLIARA